MSRTPSAPGRKRGGNTLREMSSDGCDSIPAKTSRSRVPEMTRLIGAVPEWVDGAAVPAGILASGHRIRHRKAAAVAGQRGSGPAGQRGGLRRLRANEEARLG